MRRASTGRTAAGAATSTASGRSPKRLADEELEPAEGGTRDRLEPMHEERDREDDHRAREAETDRDDSDRPSPRAIRDERRDGIEDRESDSAKQQEQNHELRLGHAAPHGELRL